LHLKKNVKFHLHFEKNANEKIVFSKGGFFFCLDFEDMQTSVLKKNTQKPNNNRDGTSFLSMIQE